MSGADERVTHPEGKDFQEFFDEIMYAAASCFARDVLRAQKEALWTEWKAQAKTLDRLARERNG